MNKMTPVYEAESLIQRDAILSHLDSLGIEAFGAQRDLSRKYADSSFDYSFEGYSATMGGFNIFVNSAQADQAKREIQAFLDSRNSVDRPQLSSDKDRFLRGSMFFLGPFALYYMVKALKNGEIAEKNFVFWSSAVLTVASTALWIIVAYFYINDGHAMNGIRHILIK